MSAIWAAFLGWLTNKVLDGAFKQRIASWVPRMGAGGWIGLFVISALISSHWWAYSRGIARTERQYEAALQDARDRDARTQAAIDAAQAEAREADLALQRLRKSLEDQDQEVIHAIREIEVEVEAAPDTECRGIDCPYDDRLLRLIYQ